MGASDPRPINSVAVFPGRIGVRGGLRGQIRPFVGAGAVLRQAGFQPTSSVARLSAFGHDFPPDCLLARMRQSWSLGPGARIALVNWRADTIRTCDLCL